MSDIVYNAEPTLAKFHASDAFIRGIMGPVGSGKSVGMCTEIVRRSIEQCCFRDTKIRKSRWGVVRNCFDDTTEILTELRGWQLFKNLRLEDRVAQLSDDGRLEYVMPLTHYRAPYTGYMIGFENEGVDFLVTPNHKLSVSKRVTRKKVWDEYKFIKAEEIYKSSSYKVKRDSRWFGSAEGSLSFFEWLGFWFAEGVASKTIRSDRTEPHWRCVITQKKNPEYVRDLFVRAELPLNETWDTGVGRFKLSVTPKTKPLIEKLSSTGLAVTKRIPQWIKCGSADQLRSFIAGFIHGDGSCRKDCDCVTACTSSKGLSDDLQEIALKAGMVANITLKSHCGTPYCINGHSGVTTSDGWTVTFVGSRKYQPVLHVQGHAGKYKGWYKHHYAGDVFCVEVPSHRVYVRRNGKAHWSSQTYVELKTTTIRTWLEWVPEDLGKMKWDAPITHHVEFPLADGTTVELEVLFVSLDRPDDIKKLKSLDLTGLFINEVCEEPKAILDMGAARVGRYPSKRDGGSTWCGVIMDTNPMDTDHWYYTLAEKDLSTERGRKIWEEIKAAEQVMRSEGLLGEKQPLMEFFRQPPALLYQNKLWVPNRGAENIGNLNDGFAYYLRQVAGKSHEWINTYLAGNYGKVVDGKPVYSEYSEGVHYPGTQLDLIEGLPILIGLDYGLTPAAVLGQCTPRGQLRIVGELCSDGMGIQRFLSDGLKPYLATNFSGFEFLVTGDPSGKTREGNEKTCEDYVRAAGFEYQPAKTNAPIARIEAVAYFLNRMVDGAPGMLLDVSCQMVRKGFAGGYHYKRVQVLGDERYKDEPDKNAYSHPHDALQYLALSVGGVQQVRDRIEERPKWMQDLDSPTRRSGGFMAR